MFSQEIKVKGKATRVRGATWTHDQVGKLFDVWTQPDIYKGLFHEKKKQGIFKSMAVMLGNLGVQRTWTECRAKIKNLKADFRKAMEKKIPFRYYEQMKKIMNLDGSSTITASPISSGGHSSRHYEDSHGESDLEEDNVPQPDVREQDAGARCFTPHPSPFDVETATSFVSERPLTPYQPLKTETSTYASSIPAITSPVATTSVIRTLHPHSGHGHSHRDMDYPTHVTPPKVQYQRYSKPSPYHHHGNVEYPMYRGTEGYHHHHEQEEDDYDEVDGPSRSSMVITHVVSNVHEPVTTVVMPSYSSGNLRNVATPAPETITLESDQPPIRLEFVVDDDNVILKQPSPTPSGQSSYHSPERHSESRDSQDFHTTRSSTSEIPATPSPIVSPIIPPRSAPTPSRRNEDIQRKVQKHPSSPGILRQQAKQKRPIPTSSHTAKPKRKEKPVDHGKKRKLLETLNRKTVETISNLLTETSQSLLKEIQDAEERFLLWEEEKRNEDRKREETMFAKLIGALQSASSTSTPQTSSSSSELPDNESSAFLTSFKTVSKRLNDMINDEIKATEETLRQWEVKVQRQEGKHSEKLFAMIINAIKTPSSVVDD